MAAGRQSAKLTVNVDGGCRGNPGPGAIGVVVRGPNGEALEKRAEHIGNTTNNVAEYRALLLGIDMAAGLGANELELISDSELVVGQIKGRFKVRDPRMEELHAEAKRALGSFAGWSIHHVRRKENAEADRLVNQALDGA